MKAQQKTGTLAKHNRLTFDGLDNLIKFTHHAAKPVNMPASFSTHANSVLRVEEKLAHELEAERKRAMTRAYSNMIPLR